MRTIVYLTGGHELTTAGKRTPLFPDGTFMHEKEFNQAVVDRLIKLFSFIKVETLRVDPIDKDTSLQERTDAANNHFKNMQLMFGKANVRSIYISVHANAMTGKWNNTWGGLETFYYRKGTRYSSEGQKLAAAIQEQLLKGTPLKDRKVKGANFHELRETAMVSALVECGFMDNIHEAKLLLSDMYRDECAREIFIGTCNYLGIEPKFAPVEVVVTDIPREEVVEAIGEIKKGLAKLEELLK